MVVRCIVIVKDTLSSMAGLAEISINFIILHVAEVPLSETDIEVLLGEAEGDKVEAG